MKILSIKFYAIYMILGLLIQQISYASYSELDDAAANAYLRQIERNLDKGLSKDDPFYREAFTRILALMKEGQIKPNKNIDGLPIFYALLSMGHYDDLAQEYYQFFEDHVPIGFQRGLGMQGNIFHFLVGDSQIYDSGFRRSLLHYYMDILDPDPCESRPTTPAIHALKANDMEYLHELSELGMLCKDARDSHGKTIIDYLMSKNLNLLRIFFPDEWLTLMKGRYKKYSGEIIEKISTSSVVVEDVECIDYNELQAPEIISHCIKKPKEGDVCDICQFDLNDCDTQSISILCNPSCEKMICHGCAPDWKEKCLKGENLYCSCSNHGQVKKFIPNSAIAAFGADRFEIFDIYLQKIRKKIGTIEGFTPCLTPDCNGGTILQGKDRQWYLCHLCQKESHLIGKEIFSQRGEEIPKPWEKERPCPYCYKAYYEITEACDHITCQVCNKEFNVVLGRSSETTYNYNSENPYDRIRRYRIPGDINKEGELYRDYQDGVLPEDDLDIEQIPTYGS